MLNSQDLAVAILKKLKFVTIYKFGHICECYEIKL